MKNNKPKLKKLVILGLLALMIVGTLGALWRELQREERILALSISGIVEVDPSVFRKGPVNIERTDRLVLLLIDPESGRPVAIKYESPLVPPQTIRIGQENAMREGELRGPFLLVGITDKDGEIFKVTPGEVFGASSTPVALGTTEFKLRLNEPFRGSLTNKASSQKAPGGRGPMMGGGGDGDPKFSIAGTIVASEALKAQMAEGDRLIVLLFDPKLARPVAFRIISNATLPQRFSITLPPGARETAQKGYFLRVISDKNNDPLGSTEGEIVGRSSEPIPLGTTDLTFELDQPYRR